MIVAAENLLCIITRSEEICRTAEMNSWQDHLRHSRPPTKNNFSLLGNRFPKFRRNIMPSSSRVCTSDTLLPSDAE
jgi:hypothetical protein